MFYLSTQSSQFYLRLYDVMHVVKNYLDSESQIVVATTRATLFD